MAGSSLTLFTRAHKEVGGGEGECGRRSGKTGERERAGRQTARERERDRQTEFKKTYRKGSLVLANCHACSTLNGDRAQGQGRACGLSACRSRSRTSCDNGCRSSAGSLLFAECRSGQNVKIGINSYDVNDYRPLFYSVCVCVCVCVCVRERERERERETHTH